MKVSLVRDDLEVSFPVLPGHEDQYEYREVKRNGRMQQVAFWKQGAILEHPEAAGLVSMGCAIPADEEAQKACGMTPEMIRAAMKAQDKVSLGIHHTDYEKFDNGEIVGYNPDGSYKRGPNWRDDVKETVTSEDDEDE